MREIKLQFWNRKSKTMSVPYTLADLAYEGFPNQYKNEYDDVLDEECDVLQYTGLKDKKGKEIYEGDIVKVYDFNRGCQECIDIEDGEQNMHRDECENYLCTQEIKWSCGYFCDEDTGDYCPPLSNDEIEMEIIGNIYQNNELLTALSSVNDGK